MDNSKETFIAPESAMLLHTPPPSSRRNDVNSPMMTPYRGALFGTPAAGRLATERPIIGSPVRPPSKRSEQLPPQDPSSRSIGALAFVDRDTEAYQLARYNLRNKRNVTEHPTLVTAGQLYGAGKSQLGRHAVERVANSRAAPDGVWAKLIKDGIREEDVKDYAKAITVVVDLKRCSPSNFVKLDVYLGHALYQSIRQQANNYTHWPELTRVAFPYTLEDVVKNWRRDTNRSIFIHFDEVGSLEEPRFDLCCGWPVIQDRSNLRLLLGRYYEFWDVVHPLLREERVYVYVSGKQTAFALLGYGLLRVTGSTSSPTRHHHLVLGALTAEDICEAYKTTQLYEGGVHLREFFATTTPALLDELCVKVCELTAGLPRMVHACLEALCQLQTDCLMLDSSAAIDTALEAAYKRITGRAEEAGRGDLDRHLLCNPEARKGALSGAYSALLLASLLDMQLDAHHGEIAIDGSTEEGDTLQLLRVVDKLDMFLDSHGCHGDMVRVRFAKWTMRHLLDQRRSIDASLLPVLPLWDAPREVLGKGEPLEWLVRTRLSYTLQLAHVIDGRTTRTWADLFAVFRDTVLATFPVPVLDREQPVRATPKVVRSAPAEAKLRDGWRGTMGEKQWPELFESGAFPVGTIGYPAPESHSPDLLVRCSNDLIAAFQCKLGESLTTWAHVQAELDKTKPLASNSCTVCLVLVAFTLGTQLQEAFRDGDATKLVVSSGKWALNSKKLEKLPDRVQRGVPPLAPVLEVHDNMQLVVLGAAGLRNLLGDESVAALEDLIKTRRSGPAQVVDSLQLSKSLLHRPVTPSVASIEQGMSQMSLSIAAQQPLPSFELERFLRDEAKIDEDGVQEYLPLLRKNKVTEAVLRTLASKSEEIVEARLKEWGVSAGGDRTMLAEAIVARFGARKI